MVSFLSAITWFKNLVLIVCFILQDDIVQVASNVGQLYLEEVDKNVQSDSGLHEYVDMTIAK